MDAITERRITIRDVDNRSADDMRAWVQAQTEALRQMVADGEVLRERVAAIQAGRM